MPIPALLIPPQRNPTAQRARSGLIRRLGEVQQETVGCDLMVGCYRCLYWGWCGKRCRRRSECEFSRCGGGGGFDVHPALCFIPHNGQRRTHGDIDRPRHGHTNINDPHTPRSGHDNAVERLEGRRRVVGDWKEGRWVGEGVGGMCRRVYGG